MELYNNNSSYFQDFSKRDKERAKEKNKATAAQPATPAANNSADSVHNQDETETESDEVQSKNADETSDPEIQSSMPVNTNGGMNFANRYK